eukprot:CAMPEP_0113722472 /NCGR_PEP_ID=MMETSP0038_2-20120614/37772_1 /TAXON_ID=2898 /ORGANISM="Cryptomonas paramecium" /LENGTH=2376 /DNA_ID=CAMNT_0000651725 /DNA_START=109 /DNA_END=7236 /DNA_ORIENTATION=+ /assembly_acc=CAM_ASM_000170
MEDPRNIRCWNITLQEYSAGTVLTTDGRLLVYGGCGAAGRLNDLHQLDLNTLQWTDLNAASVGTLPPTTCGAGIAYYNQTMIVFGGISSAGLLPDVYSFDIQSLSWSLAPVTGDIPPGRSFVTLTTLLGRHYVYGGQTVDFYTNGLDRNVYELDAVSLRWTKYPPNAVAPSVFLFAFGAQESSRRLLVLGGTTSIASAELSVLHNELYEFSLVTRMWTQLNSTGTKPYPSFSSHMGCLGNTAYVYGGATSVGYSNTVYRLDLTTMVWSIIAPQNSPHAPTIPRLVNSFALGTTKMYIFGGSSDTAASSINVDPALSLGDLYEFDLATAKWASLTASSSASANALTPSARVGCTLRVLNSSLYLFGGTDDGVTGNGTLFFNQLYKLDPLRLTWTFLGPSGTSGVTSDSIIAGDAPSPRARHAASIAGQKLYVYGGTGVSGPLQDFFVLDFGSLTPIWSQILRPTNIGTVWPGPRTLTRMVTIGNYLYLFGGLNGVEFVSYNFFNDLLYFDVISSTWTNITDYSGDRPQARYSHGMAALGTVIYIFGGQNTTGPLGDLHSFDTVTRRWTCENPSYGAEGPPEPRYGMGLVALDFHRLILFGGGNYFGVLNDFYLFDASSIAWTWLYTSGSGPSQRRDLTMAEANQRVLVFGGSGGSGSGLLNDLFAVDGPTDVGWPLNAAAGLFVSVYDWDTLLLDPVDGVDRLANRVVLCTRLFPCAMEIVGQRNGDRKYEGILMRAGNGSIKCASADGCTQISIQTVEVSCVDSAFVTHPPFEMDGTIFTGSKTRFHGCRTSLDGGGVRCFGGGASLTLINSSFTNMESAGNGGAFVVMGCKAILEGTSFLDCIAGGSGGAIAAGGYVCYGEETLETSVLQISNCSFVNCQSAEYGGALSIDSSQASMTLSSSVLSSCTANLSGGALSLRDGSSATLSNLSYTSNKALQAGGALSMAGSSFATVTRSNFSFNVASGVGGGAISVVSSDLAIDLANCHDNSAPSGGGGALFWQGVEPRFVGSVNQSNSAASTSLLNSAICGPRNTANFGPCLASSYTSLFFTDLPSKIYPGISFKVVLFKKDAYNQTITTDSASLVQTVAVVYSSKGQVGIDGSVSITGEFIGILSGGRTVLNMAVKPTYQLVDTHQGLTTLKGSVLLLVYGTDVDTNIQMKTKAVVPNFASGFDVCPRGYILNLESTNGGGQMGFCTQCGVQQYSVSPLAGPTAGVPSCFNCLPLAVCNGGDEITFKKGTWTIANGMYMLIGCPRGYQLVNSIGGQFSHDVQECIQCGSSQYVIDSNNSAFSCQNCPLGARCDGSTFTSLVEGAVWVVDNSTGRYILQSCPPGYEWQGTTLDAQQCSRCEATFYCVGGTTPAVACRSGTYAPPGSNSSSACVPSVMVQVVATLSISKDEFGSAEELNFINALAATAEVNAEYVYIAQVTTARRRRRSISSIQVTAQVAVDSTTQAQNVANKITKDSLDTQLAARALPKTSSLLAMAILPSSSGADGISITLVASVSIGGFVLVLILILGGSILWRRLKQQAAYRAFLIAFRSAKPGDRASKRLTPYELHRHYVGEQVLGRGAFGCVVKMRTLKGNQSVAIKLLVPERGTAFDEREKRQLLREAAVLELMTSSKCDHAVHLAGIEAIGVRPDVAWFVLEFLYGDNMESVIRDPERGPVSDMEAIKIARNVLAALKVMHAEGLVHRDIKPANIMRSLPNPDSGTHRLTGFSSAFTNALGSVEHASHMGIKAMGRVGGGPGGSGEFASNLLSSLHTGAQPGTYPSHKGVEPTQAGGLETSKTGDGGRRLSKNKGSKMGSGELDSSEDESVSRSGSTASGKGKEGKGGKDGKEAGSDESMATYKLIDFGTALGVDERLARDTMMTMGAGRAVGAGTPPYMSPEMFKEPEKALYPTDLWSLGVTIFEMVSGVLPFQAESDLLFSVAIAGNMDEHAPSVLDKLPDDRRSKFDHNLARVISQALEKRVSERFQSVDEMHDAVYSCLIDRGEAVYSVFISYRVATELPLARLLFDGLNHTVTPGGHRVTVYLDNARLVKGADWEEGFASGLLHSLCFFPLLSYGATAPLAEIPSERRDKAHAAGWEERPAGRDRLTGKAGDAEDNLLKEFTIAVSLLERRQEMEQRGWHIKPSPDEGEEEEFPEHEETDLELAFPILVGRPFPLGHVRYPGMGDFFAVQAGGGRYPDTPSPATAEAAADFLERRAGFDAPLAQATRERSVAATVKSLTALQGCKLWDIPAGSVPLDLNKEQHDLIGRGFAGPAVELDGEPLTSEQHMRCQSGLDEEQLRMLKAMVAFHVPSFHEIIDRAVMAQQERLRAKDINQQLLHRKSNFNFPMSSRRGGRRGTQPGRSSLPISSRRAPGKARTSSDVAGP